MLIIQRSCDNVIRINKWLERDIGVIKWHATWTSIERVNSNNMWEHVEYNFLHFEVNRKVNTNLDNVDTKDNVDINMWDIICPLNK